MSDDNQFTIISLTDDNDCVPEYQQCVDLLDTISHDIAQVRRLFLSHMNKSYLSYDIEINGIQFPIRPAFTKQEHLDQERMKKEIFSLFMTSAINSFIDEIDSSKDHDDYFKFVLHPMRVQSHESMQDKLAKDTKVLQKNIDNLHQDTQIFSKDYEDILSKNPKYFLEQAYNFVHKGPDSIDEELLEIMSFRRVLHNYMVSDACTKERDRIYNMKTKSYFSGLIDGSHDDTQGN